MFHQVLSRSLRESKVQFVVEDTRPFREGADGTKQYSTYSTKVIYVWSSHIAEYGSTG